MIGDGEEGCNLCNRVLGSRLLMHGEASRFRSKISNHSRGYDRRLQFYGLPS